MSIELYGLLFQLPDLASFLRTISHHPLALPPSKPALLTFTGELTGQSDYGEEEGGGGMLSALSRRAYKAYFNNSQALPSSPSNLFLSSLFFNGRWRLVEKVNVYVEPGV